MKTMYSQKQKTIYYLIVCSLLSVAFIQSSAQNYTPKIEACPCLVKADPRLIMRCGYLVVPENRKDPKNKNIVKIPFVFARQPGMDSTKNITLATTGGPGYSTINPGDSISYNSGRLRYGGFISFNQRGVKNSIPCLDCPEVELAKKNSLIKGTDGEKEEIEAIKKCRARLTQKGIDLNAYTTIESAADIEDLRKALHIESLTLFGWSYSGGLMLTVARNYPNGIRSILLDSPLPGFVNYEEQALFNHNEAFNLFFDDLEADSLRNKAYPDLRKRFQQYFTTLNNKELTADVIIDSQTYKIKYGKQELLDMVIDMLNSSQYREIPGMLTKFFAGNFEPYISEYLKSRLKGNNSLSYGMRYSVYCSEQINYANKAKVHEQERILPWFSNYRFNNVDHPICDCWNVKPEDPVVKTFVYSTIPILITGGKIDPWCRPFYYDAIKRTIPNAQILLFKNRGHMAGFSTESHNYLDDFMKDPYKKIISYSSEVEVQNK
jgi:pimeloyl-ACP methyl ester carboxylesterase